jgi:hypothetical protein
VRQALFCDVTQLIVAINAVLEQPVGPFSRVKFQEDRKPLFFDFLTLEDGTDRLFRNVGKKLPLYTA